MCVGGRPLGDNTWHEVSGGRQGHNLLVMVDDGISEDSRNESVMFHPLPPLHVDPHNGVVVGGFPKLMGMEVQEVLHDLHHGEFSSCLFSVVLSITLNWGSNMCEETLNLPACYLRIKEVVLKQCDVQLWILRIYFIYV